MKSILSALFTAAAFLVAASMAPTAAYCEGQPKIEVAPQVYEMGNVEDDTRTPAVFKIKNTGGAELVIFDVKPTCGCTVANLSSRKLAPGETATLDAVYNSRNASGQIRRFINIRSNDPASENVSVGIAVNVIPKPAPDITLSAYNVTNLQMAAGSKDGRSLKLTNTGQKDLVIDEITATKGISAEMDGASVPPGRTVKPNLTLKPGETRDLRVVTSPGIQSGSFQEVLTIRTNSSKKPVVTFVAQGFVQG